MVLWKGHVLFHSRHCCCPVQLLLRCHCCWWHISNKEKDGIKNLWKKKYFFVLHTIFSLSSSLLTNYGLFKANIQPKCPPVKGLWLALPGTCSMFKWIFKVFKNFQRVQKWHQQLPHFKKKRISHWAPLEDIEKWAASGAVALFLPFPSLPTSITLKRFKTGQQQKHPSEFAPSEWPHQEEAIDGSFASGGHLCAKWPRN